MASIKVELTDKDIKAIATRVVVELKANKNISKSTLYTVKEVAEIVKLHHYTVLEHIRIGLLKANRVGKSYSINEEQLNEYINNK